MKSKVVLWGENAANEKLLIGIELLERENKILIHTIPHKVATEEFYQMMLDKWRENQDITWPEEKQTIERPLSMSDNLLPDDIKVDRTDLISRAQAEWHFIVLSNKLYESYKSEVDEIKEKIDNLVDFSEDQWKDLVEFWNKVSSHLKEHTLFKDHGTILKERTNILFDKLKELKKTAQKHADVKSKELANELAEEINAIEVKIKEGLGLGPLFDDLKKVQEKLKNPELTRGDRNNIFSKIDNAFKTLKEQKGSRPQRNDGGKNQEMSRTDSRLSGLIEAIKKMESNIRKDQNELEFQNKRIATTEGKFELQIRQAKIKLVEQSLASKQAKLDDMIKTREMLESKIKNLKDKVQKSEAIEQVKQKIAANIVSNKEQLADQNDKLNAAANEINESKSVSDTPKEENTNDDSMISAIKGIAEDTIQDLVTTAKAIGDVIEDRIEHTIESILDNKDTAKEEE